MADMHSRAPLALEEPSVGKFSNEETVIFAFCFSILYSLRGQNPRKKKVSYGVKGEG